MGKWTPTPWAWDRDGPIESIFICPSGDKLRPFAKVSEQLSYSDGEANADRIVQCVNALAEDGLVEELCEAAMAVVCGPGSCIPPSRADFDRLDKAYQAVYELIPEEEVGDENST